MILAWMIAILFVGGLVAWLLGHSPLWGLVIGSAIASAPLVLLGIPIGIMALWRPARPRCKCGRCTSGQFRYIGPDSVRPNMTYDYQCPSCERRYRLRGASFHEILPDHSTIPYMTHSKFGRWTHDQAEESQCG